MSAATNSRSSAGTIRSNTISKGRIPNLDSYCLTDEVSRPDLAVKAYQYQPARRGTPMSSDLRGSAITVKGVIDPEELGITTMHEHLFLDMSTAWGNSATPVDAFGLAMSREPVKLENLWWIKRQPHANIDNTRFNDYKEALDEVSYFTREGGRTIVECSTRGLGRDPKLLRWVSNEAGVNIVAGTGYYTSGLPSARRQEQDRRGSRRAFQKGHSRRDRRHRSEGGGNRRDWDGRNARPTAPSR